MIKITVRLILALASLLFLSGLFVSGDLAEIFSPEAAAEAARTQALTPVEVELARASGQMQLETAAFFNFWLSRIFLTSVGALAFIVVGVAGALGVRKAAGAVRELLSKSPSVQVAGDVVIIDGAWVFDQITGRYFAIDDPQGAELSRAQVAQVRFFMRGLAEVSQAAKAGDTFARDLIDWAFPVLGALPHPGKDPETMVFQAETINQNQKTIPEA